MRKTLFSLLVAALLLSILSCAGADPPTVLSGSSEDNLRTGSGDNPRAESSGGSEAESSDGSGAESGNNSRAESNGGSGAESGYNSRAESGDNHETEGSQEAESNQVTEGSQGTEGDIYEIVMQYPTLGNTPQDLKMIEDAVNARTEPEIGVHITFSPVTASDLGTVTNMMFSLGEKLDIVECGFSVGLGDYVNKGMLRELDDLVEEYGQSIVKAEGIAMSGGYFAGKLYALPSEEKMGRVRALFCRQDILEKYNIEADSNHIYTIEEISDIFAKVRAGERSDFYCLATNMNDRGIYTNFDIVDMLGSSLASGGILNYGRDSAGIVNYFATNEYERACRMIRAWYQNGYLNPDCNTIIDATANLMRSGNYFAYFNNAEPDMLASQSRILRGYVDSGVVPLYTSFPFAVTQNFRISMWGVSTSCAEPVKAMQWLNMLWRDTEISNLITYGIEGTHYQFDSEPPIIRYPDGVDASTASYFVMLSVWGDKSKLYVMEPLDETYYQALADFNSSILPEHTSGALGYCFDFSPVRTQHSAVLEVIQRYEVNLRLGVLDIDKALPEFRAALAAAGIDEVIAENQRQFDDWIASRE